MHDTDFIISYKNLVRPYRKLVRDSTIDARFVPVNAKEKDYSMEKNCQLFLFNDCILIAKPLKKSFFESNPELKLKPITVLDLRGAVVLDAIQTGTKISINVICAFVYLW